MVQATGLLQYNWRWLADITPLGQNPPVELEHNVRRRFMLQERGFWKLNFRIGGRKPPDITPWFRTPCQRVLNQGLCLGFLRPPILKFSFQVGDVWFCGFYPALPLNGGFWPGVMLGGVMSGHHWRWWRLQGMLKVNNAYRAVPEDDGSRCDCMSGRTCSSVRLIQVCSYWLPGIPCCHQCCLWAGMYSHRWWYLYHTFVHYIHLFFLFLLLFMQINCYCYCYK